jgi:uncharacterized protein YhbP (UPF0306 family)
MMSTCRALVLSTVSERAEPACAPVYFQAKSITELDFVSKANSQHSLNLQHSPRAAGAIFKEGEQFTDICGLQLRGEVIELDGSAESEARELYIMRYPEISSNDFLLNLFMTTPMHRFCVHWLRFSDHQEGWVRRREWEF